MSRSWTLAVELHTLHLKSANNHSHLFVSGTTKRLDSNLDVGFDHGEMGLIVFLHFLQAQSFWERAEQSTDKVLAISSVLFPQSLLGQKYQCLCMYSMSSHTLHRLQSDRSTGYLCTRLYQHSRLELTRRTEAYEIGSSESSLPVEFIKVIGFACHILTWVKKRLCY